MKKVGIVFGGGGAKGAFQIGVLKKIKELGYEIVATTGTSIGSFNSAFVAAGQIDLLMDLWLTGKVGDIIANPGVFGKYINLLLTGGLFDAGHLKKQLYKLLDYTALQAANVKCKFSMTPLDLKRTAYYGNQDRDFNMVDLMDAIVGSMTLPIGYPVAKFRGMSVVDGGFTEVVPVEAMLDLVDSETQIIIIPCNDLEGKPEIYKNGIHGLLGSAEALYYSLTDMLWAEAERDDVKIGLKKYWQDTNRFTLIQPKYMAIKEAGDFDLKKIQTQAEHGYEMASGVLT